MSKNSRVRVQLITTEEARELHLYEGPIKFRGECKNCESPRNTHCGRCKGCPGWHLLDCMVSYSSGAWH